MFTIRKETLCDWEILKDGVFYSRITKKKDAYSVMFKGIPVEYTGYRYFRDAKQFAMS